jgi:flagellar hook protein FlgE
VDGANNTDFAAGTPAVVPVAFDPTKPATYSHSLPISVYDSLGNAHQLTQYFVKREGTTAPEQSNWEVYYRLNGAPLDAADTPHKLAFASSGVLSPANANLTLNIPNPGGLASPAAALAINLNYGGSTQFGGEFSPNFTQTGYATGEYAGMSISSDGGIVANYTNGETQAMGFLALADFNNLQGLQPAGGNAWIETGASGQPVVGRPGSNGLATIKGQAVEESNVDMSQELVNMIIAQRTYQANAQTIKTQDQIMQTLMQMR